MRNHRNVLGALGVMMAGCSSEMVARTPPAPVNWESLQTRAVADGGADTVTAKERSLPDAYALALTSPGFAALGPLLEDEAHFVSPGEDDAHGREAVTRAHDLFLGSFDDRKITIGRVWRTPGEQTVEWTFTGTQERPWMGIAATHKPVAFNGLTLLWTKDDGSIADVHLYVDVALVKAQLGAGPKELLAVPPPSAPAGEAKVLEQAPTGSAEEQGNVAAVSSWLGALESNRESAYVGATTEDVDIRTLEHPPAHGSEGMRAYYRAIHKAIGQLNTTIDNAWAVGPFAIVEYSIAGEQLAPIGWIPAQRDKVVRWEVVDICEIRGGKISQVWRYDNPMQVLGSTP
jgi:predicted ester cyclase